MGKAGVLPAAQKQGERMAVDMSATCPAEEPQVGDGDAPSQIRANQGGRAWPLQEDFHGPHEGQINGRKQTEEAQGDVSFQWGACEVGREAGAASAPSQPSPSSQASS